MGTEHYYVCDQCKAREWIYRLFEALQEQIDGKLPKCAKCGKPTHIELVYSFGLECRVVGAFLPGEIGRWTNKGKQWEFYPFLVVVESLEDKEQSVWMPYWHIVTSKDGSVGKPYGQFAPVIPIECFESMVRKARAAGFKV